MAKKYFCDCCGKETDIPDEYMHTKIEMMINSNRKPIYISSCKTLLFGQDLCDECKENLYNEVEDIMFDLRKKYSQFTNKPNYNWGY